MKKALIFLLTLAFVFIVPMTFASDEYVQLVTADGKKVTYRNSTEPVMIPTTYNTPERDFRGVWVSQYAGDVKNYTTKESFQAELLSVLDTMEKYRLNTIIYHLRIMNDALYDTKLSPQGSWIKGLDFNEWDYLEWFIDEVHRRGMEFHAWLNPYRIQNSVASPKVISERYKDYPLNPASNPENILVGNSGAILNPGEPAVREFVIDTCMELIAKYDIDAIHFDDYFYISMSPSADLDTYNKYKHLSNTTNIEDWRREQVDLFIHELSKEMRLYNRTYNRQVQLGISPSGIWRNGDGIVHGYDKNGNAITNGSNTSGFAHYGNYLFSDTKKWIDEEWIDYIIPQVYWSFTQPVAPYADIVDWWAKVVKYKDVNLYIGMGLYMSENDKSYSWYTDKYEAANQILYNTKHDKVDGVSIYSYKHLNASRNQIGLNKILNEYWTNPGLTPIIETANPVIPESVNDVNIVKTAKGFVLSWDSQKNARKYAIYRSEGIVDINDPRQLVGVVGENKQFDLVIFSDKADITKDYNYAVVSVSGTNTKGEAYFLDTKTLDDGVNFPFASFDDIYFTGKLYPNNSYQIRFREAKVYAGSPLEYTLYYSHDQENWFKVEGKLIQSGTSYALFNTYPYTIAPTYYKVVGENELGIIESNIIVATPEINDFPTFMDYVFIIMKDRLSKVIPSGS
ncbi:MAG TPA: family 10 glycosylhydrolase [Acholeplasmataceae bacterium]|nr:family 10 glycosylhydrolase [Acholeplasmataceae bacterium]